MPRKKHYGTDPVARAGSLGGLFGPDPGPTPASPAPTGSAAPANDPVSPPAAAPASALAPGEYRAMSVTPGEAALIAGRGLQELFRAWISDYRGPLVAVAKDTYGEMGNAIAIVDLHEIKTGDGNYRWCIRNIRLIDTFRTRAEMGIFHIKIGAPE